jgi:hypothetical protein
MATLGLSLAGQKTAAKARLKQPTGKLGLSIILSIIEQHMPNTARFVDDEPAAPQQTASNDLFIEGLGRIGAKRIFTNKPEELTEAQSTFRPNRHGKDWTFNERHRRQPSRSNRTGMIWRHEPPAPATAAREPQFRSISRLFNDNECVNFL